MLAKIIYKFSSYLAENSLQSLDALIGSCFFLGNRCYFSENRIKYILRGKHAKVRNVKGGTYNYHSI